MNLNILPPNLKIRFAQRLLSVASGTHPADPASRTPITLSKARCGERLRVVGVRPSSPACIRLKELGFCESAEICKVVDGSALICQMRGVRLAIGRSLGADVMVEPVLS